VTVSGSLQVVDWVILGYFLAINTSYAVLIGLAAIDCRTHLGRSPSAGYDDDMGSPFTPGVSIVAAAYNEEATIVESVKATLSLRYPEFEVIIVVDGATDGTFAELQRAFDLTEVPRVVPADVPTREPFDAIYSPRSGGPLTVATKRNSGRADSLNAGLNLARLPLVCFVDADSILESEALLRVAKPFLDDPERVVATGGVIRAVNGCTVVQGRVSEVRMPRGWLARIQVIEYLRAFLLGRAGWSKLGSLVIISGAFGLFRRDVVVDCGGLDAGCIGEDAELVCRIHRRMREQRRPYRIVFVADPVSWTEVPSSRAVLARQRRRWSRGLAEVIWRHRRMMLNPRYGRIGLVALPYYLLFELVAPFVELFGVITVIVGLGLGVVNVAFAILFLLVAVGYALLLSVAALAIEEWSFHRYSRWRDMWSALSAAAVENFGYRQLTAIWQLHGVWDALFRRRQVWGEMTRQGFQTSTVRTAAVSAGAASGPAR
jgi:cellulose synthase/poly-beta-1,6-N-acetylglucosamine synthase-like glycosyltransferase